MVRFLAILGLVFVACTASARDRVLQIAATEFPPYTSEAMEGHGFVTQIVSAAFAERGYEIKVIFLPWARALESTKVGKYDGLFTTWYREDRAEFLSYSDALPPNEVGLFKRRDSKIEFDDLSDLKGKSIGIVRGYGVPPEFADAGLETTPAVDDLENVRKLLRGRIDLIVSDRAAAIHTLVSGLSGSIEDMEWIAPAINTELQYFVVPKSLAESEALLADFNVGLAAIRANGTVARIIKDNGF
ncbi:hypothetical protein LCGC14_1179460 [marine sediment metagenome]|uniref:Solute-binding protein family 3/N-terminal domain-containing protein n=1 Tax=marine sediment metagenome TaxID=412755 RepID=A0A0F9P5K1_9ZZZZ